MVNNTQPIWLSGKRGHVYADTDTLTRTRGHGKRVDMFNTDMENSDIQNVLMENADMENADMEFADMENTDMENAVMENADMENADKHVKNSELVDVLTMQSFLSVW